MGATIVALWSCVDRAVLHHRGDVWNRVLQGLHRPIAPHGRAPIRTEPHFQFLLYLLPIWAEEQSPRVHRHPPRPRHPSLGTPRSLSILPHQPHRNRRSKPRLDHLRQHPVSPLGLHRDGVTINDNVDE